MISLVLTLSWKYGDCASTVATQLFFHGTPHVVFICPHYSIQIQQICNSGNSDSAHRLMFDNNLLHDVISHDRTWFCQISKYRTSGFPWQAEFDTCNAKPFQLLLHAWHYWKPRVVTHILCQGGGLKKCLLSKLQGSAFTRTVTIATVTVPESIIFFIISSWL